MGIFIFKGRASVAICPSWQNSNQSKGKLDVNRAVMILLLCYDSVWKAKWKHTKHTHIFNHNKNDKFSSDIRHLFGETPCCTNAFLSQGSEYATAFLDMKINILVVYRCRGLCPFSNSWYTFMFEFQAHVKS